MVALSPLVQSAIDAGLLNPFSLRLLQPPQQGVPGRSPIGQASPSERLFSAARPIAPAGRPVGALQALRQGAAMPNNPFAAKLAEIERMDIAFKPLIRAIIQHPEAFSRR